MARQVKSAAEYCEEIAALKDQISELEETNAELEDQLDSIAVIVAPEEESHLAVLAGIDFFTVEVPTWRGLVTYYIWFFIHLESRRVSLAGITRHPDQAWMQQVARNATRHGDS